MRISPAPLPLLALVVSLSALRCTAAQGRAVAPVLLSLGEAACEAFVPMALPGYGAIDILGCKGAEAGIAAILGATVPATGPSLGGGGAAFTSTEPHRPLRIAGRVVYLVRAPADVVAAAQGRIDAQVKR